MISKVYQVTDEEFKSIVIQACVDGKLTVKEASIKC